MSGVKTQGGRRAQDSACGRERLCLAVPGAAWWPGRQVEGGGEAGRRQRTALSASGRRRRWASVPGGVAAITELGPDLTYILRGPR